MDDYPIKRWHYIAAFLLFLATGIVPAEPEKNPQTTNAGLKRTTSAITPLYEP